MFKIIYRPLLFLAITSFFSFCSASKENKQMAFIDNRITDPFEKLASSLSTKETSHVKKIIVLTFVNQDGKEHILGSVFAEKLTTELVKQKKMIVLDRMIHSKKLKDSGLELGGNYDLSLLKKLGSLLSVDAIAIGIVSPTGKTGYDINCRIIDVQNGLIINAEEAYYTEAGE